MFLWIVLGVVVVAVVLYLGSRARGRGTHFDESRARMARSKDEGRTNYSPGEGPSF